MRILNNDVFECDVLTVRSQQEISESRTSSKTTVRPYAPIFSSRGDSHFTPAANVDFWGNKVYFGGNKVYSSGFSKILRFLEFLFVAGGVLGLCGSGEVTQITNRNVFNS